MDMMLHLDPAPLYHIYRVLAVHCLDLSHQHFFTIPHNEIVNIKNLWIWTRLILFRFVGRGHTSAVQPAAFDV